MTEFRNDRDLPQCSMKFHEIENSIQKEEMDYDDILRGNFEESFLNLTLKEKLWINWFTSFCRSDFVFKGDDDIMVNPFMLQDLVSKIDPSLPSVYGSRLIHSPRIKNPRSKYFVDKSYWPEDYYPDYVSGGGFIITNSTIFAIAKGKVSPEQGPLRGDGMKRSSSFQSVLGTTL